MDHHLPEQMLERLSRFVEERIALNFPKERWRDLERGAKSAAAQCGFGDTEEFVESLVASSLTRKEIEVLASHLTVGETYFLRDKPLFQNLEQRILPELIKERGEDRRLRIWSAGCCTGEEPYSIAMLLRKLVPNLADWNITILATDINPCFLKVAASGIYKEWSFRDTPLWVKSKYFEKIGRNQYRIAASLKEMVTFSYLNLAEDVYPALLNNTNAMDIVLCRNVLMYFSPDQVSKVANNLCAALVDGGWLIVSPSETSLIRLPQLVRANFPGTTLFGKTKRATQHTHEQVPAAPANLPEAIPRYAPSDLPETGAPEPEPVASKPNSFHEALRLYETRCYVDAAEHLQIIIQNEPQNPDAAALLARVFANEGKLGEAAHWCDQALRARKLSAELHYLKATILQEQGDLAGTVNSLRRAIYLEPDFVLPHFAMGNVAAHQENSRNAGKHFMTALSLLDQYSPEEILPGADGITAARLREIINATLQQEQLA